MQVIPVLDTEQIQKAANEAATKAQIKAIDDFYNSYDSPYKKAITEELKKQDLGRLELPKIMGLINEGLNQKMTEIANEAVAKSFIPLIEMFFIKAEKEVNFSDILKKIISVHSIQNDSDVNCQVIRHDKYDWLEIKISLKSNALTYEKNYLYQFTLHTVHKKECKYQFLSLPNNSSTFPRMMKVSRDGVTFEIPFTPNVLQDQFIAFVAQMLMAKSEITMDVEDFEYEMFYNED
jgi:hypothetical protein